MGAFTQAFKELSSLTISSEIPVPHAGHHRAEKPSLAFSQVMEEVVNRRPCKDIEALYGSKLTRHLLMARVNLILAICSTIHDLPELLAAGIISVLSYYYRQLKIINLHNTLLNYFLISYLNLRRNALALPVCLMSPAVTSPMVSSSVPGNSH